MSNNKRLWVAIATVGLITSGVMAQQPTHDFYGTVKVNQTNVMSYIGNEISRATNAEAIITGNLNTASNSLNSAIDYTTLIIFLAHLS